MEIKKVHRISRTATILLAVAGATFGSVAGVAASMWGGIFFIVPIVTFCFGIVGALVGGAIEFGLRLKWPIDYDL